MASRSFFVSRRSGDSPLDPSPEPKLSPRVPLRRRTCSKLDAPHRLQPESPRAQRRERGDPQRDGQPSGGLFSPAEVIGTTCGPYNGRAVSGIAWRVCTRHATSGMGPSLPACFPSWRRAMIPLPSESASRVYTQDEISGMEDADGPAKVRTWTWTRQGGTFPLPAGSVALYPGRKSIPRVHTGRDFRHEPRWATVSERVCPRSRTPERTLLANCQKRGLEPPTVGDRPRRRTGHYPRGSSVRLL